MSLLEDLLRKGMEQLEDNVLTPEQFDDLTGSVSDELDKLEDGPIKEAGKASLGELVSKKDDVLHLKKSGLVMFMTHVAGGKDHDAQMEFIRGTSDADALIAGMRDDAKMTVQQKRTEDEWLDTALEIAKSVGMKGAQVLLPLLLAAL